MSDPQFNPMPPPLAYYAPRPMMHSRLGIISFVMSLAAWLALIAGIVIIGVIEAMQLGRRNGITTLLGLMVLASAAIALVGTALGIAGCFVADRRKLFAILGAVLNGLVITIVVGFMVIGLMVR